MGPMREERRGQGRKKRMSFLYRLFGCVSPVLLVACLWVADASKMQKGWTYIAVASSVGVSIQEAEGRSQV
jgi:hypothetical protein